MALTMSAEVIHRHNRDLSDLVDRLRPLAHPLPGPHVSPG
jgi:hypothetical protein